VSDGTRAAMSETAAERNLRLLVEYDGTAYCGWQFQENGPSIQAELLRALEGLTGQRPVISVAGRTDAGVHAVGQVASLRIVSRVPTRRFASALNSQLPNDISVHRVDEMPSSFDARHSAHSKRYRYRIYQGSEPAALEPRAWYRRRPLAVAPMREAAALLIGEHDFESFRSVHCDAPHARRRMLDITLDEQERPPVGRTLDIVFHANAYCRHMCRILTGTLVDVGRGRKTPSDVARVLEARDRTLAGLTAPPRGLTLLEVLY